MKKSKLIIFIVFMALCGACQPGISGDDIDVRGSGEIVLIFNPNQLMYPSGGGVFREPNKVLYYNDQLS